MRGSPHQRRKTVMMRSQDRDVVRHAANHLKAQRRPNADQEVVHPNAAQEVIHPNHAKITGLQNETESGMLMIKELSGPQKETESGMESKENRGL